MKMCGGGVDHVGYAVKDIEKAKEMMETLGYVFGETVEDRDRKIRIAFGEMDGCRVELVAPAGGGNPVGTHLSKVGPSPYHICYRSEDMDADIGRLTGNGFKVLIPPVPAAAFKGKRVAFLYSLAVGLIEIAEE